MNWYTAKVLFRWEVAGKPRPFEESYILVRANSVGAAFRAAGHVAKANEESYDNPHRQRVNCTLVAVLDVQEVLEDEISEGVEVYSRRVSRRAAIGMLRAVKEERNPMALAALNLLTENRSAG